MLIAIEGPDGCGKSTIARALAERLSCRLLAFPDRTTTIGRHIDAMLKQPECDPYVMQALQTANRLEHIDLLREHSGAHGNALVLDRYWQSGYVYSTASSMPVDVAASLTEKAMPPADLNVLVWTPAEDCYQKRKTGAGADQYDGRPLEWHKLIGRSYAALWFDKIVSYGSEVWVEVDTSERSPDDVVSEIERYCYKASALVAATDKAPDGDAGAERT